MVIDNFYTSIVISRRWYLDCSCPTWIHAGIQRAKTGEPRVILFKTVWLTLSNVTINKVSNLESNSVAMQASPVGLWVCGYVLDRDTRIQTEVRIRFSPPPPCFLWVETVLVYSLCHGTLVPGVACPCNEIAHCRGYCSLIQVIELSMASCSLPFLGRFSTPSAKTKNQPNQSL